MFSLQHLFQSVQCPEYPSCTRQNCIFSHRADLPSPPPLTVSSNEGKAASTRQLPSTAGPSVVPTKRASVSIPPRTTSNPIGEPPRKLQVVGTGTGSVRKPNPIPIASTSSSVGPPVLRVSAASSRVAVPVRQTMLRTLYDHFTVLYEKILPKNPDIASEHALRQEDEVYQKSTKASYRVAVIHCAASLKRRQIPDSIFHASVGTTDDLVVRAEAQNSIKSLRLVRAHLEPHLLSLDTMRTWGYIVDIPEGEGGSEPSREGQTVVCERCREPFLVTPHPKDECLHHWGRPYSKKTSGQRERFYSCCSKSVTENEGCIRGPHVFYESDPNALHARHSFSFLNSTPSAQEIVALDCEMIYTTGGMRVARVSVVDGTGAEVFDELVRMDDGVYVLDFNTRFSGITEEAYTKATRSLSEIRQALDAIISSSTILIGHGLENDLRTLRMIHHQCIDTAIMFPHPAGHPYRKALRDLAREHLGIRIQAGGSAVGHSSIEDSVATLDLVRWFVLEKQKVSKSSLSANPR
ncbi:ribonuclease H-like protein [Guyanagaster necrorhizus]|uniref:Ribonuclease H-like protein n=1 Tax=Guyanagaster necrorhizus TaxID=856835 RepID=A0A9P7VYW5_9AGAR|nr:ribonuclease H-like protein [Guyanagaster necrorhizus MCA 3950]KAG7449108.1 ribonuclease H-like protein [Guyanagaster necrorhizus MCA 3950]